MDRVLAVIIMTVLVVFLEVDAEHWVHKANQYGATPTIHHEAFAGKATLF